PATPAMSRHATNSTLGGQGLTGNDGPSRILLETFVTFQARNAHHVAHKLCSQKKGNFHCTTTRKHCKVHGNGTEISATRTSHSKTKTESRNELAESVSIRKSRKAL